MQFGDLSPDNMAILEALCGLFATHSICTLAGEFMTVSVCPTSSGRERGREGGVVWSGDFNLAVRLYFCMHWL